MTMTRNSNGLAQFLAIPEREPDDLFVSRVDHMLDMATAAQAAKKSRLEQLAVEGLAAAAVLYFGHDLLSLEAAGAAVLPELGGLGMLALAWGLALFLIAGLLTEREGFA